MRRYTLSLAIVVAGSLASSRTGAQHQRHETEVHEHSSANVTQCLHVQPVVDNIIAGARKRAESARVSNSPAELRAAIEQLEAALRDIRSQLAPCSAAGSAPDQTRF